MCSPHQASAKGLHGPAALVLFFRVPPPLTAPWQEGNCRRLRLDQLSPQESLNASAKPLAHANGPMRPVRQLIPPRCSRQAGGRGGSKEALRRSGPEDLARPMLPLIPRALARGRRGSRSAWAALVEGVLRFPKHGQEGGHGKPQYRVQRRHTTCPLARRVRVSQASTYSARQAYTSLGSSSPFTVPSQPSASFTVRSRPPQRSKSSRL